MTAKDMFHRASIDVAATPDVVYEAVRQLDRMGEWSPENRGGRWIAGDGTSVGDQFEGDNKIGDREWSAVATINTATPGEEYGFYTGTEDTPYVQWTYRMEATGEGTTLTEEWDVLTLPPTLADLADEKLAARKTMVQESMAATLAAMKSTLEG